MFAESVEELEESLKALIIRNNVLLDLLNNAGIEAPPFVGPKLLRCVVAVQKSNSSPDMNKFEVQPPADDVPSNKKCERAVTKNRNRKTTKTKKNTKNAQKLVLDRTFRQRVSTNGKKNGTTVNTAESDTFTMQENSSLEKINILEQNQILSKSNMDENISVLPLFTQLKGEFGELKQTFQPFVIRLYILLPFRWECIFIRTACSHRSRKSNSECERELSN